MPRGSCTGVDPCACQRARCPRRRLRRRSLRALRHTRRDGRQRLLVRLRELDAFSDAINHLARTGETDRDAGFDVYGAGFERLGRRAYASGTVPGATAASRCENSIDSEMRVRSAHLYILQQVTYRTCVDRQPPRSRTATTKKATSLLATTEYRVHRTNTQ